MKNARKRISKITDELITYLFSMGATDISVNIKEMNDEFVIVFCSNYKNDQDEKIIKLIKALKCPKEDDIEEYYWGLAGGSGDDTELALIGMMIEKFEVSVVDDRLTITLYKPKK